MMTNDKTAFPPRISAAELKVPPPPPSPPSVDRQAAISAPPAAALAREWTEAEREALFSDLRNLQAESRSNKGGEAYALITECILRGINTTGHIIGVLKPLGYDGRQIGAMLTKGKRPYWQKNSEGRYFLTAHHPLMTAGGEENSESAPPQ
jgi:hypothetical protein